MSGSIKKDLFIYCWVKSILLQKDTFERDNFSFRIKTMPNLERLSLEIAQWKVLFS